MTDTITYRGYEIDPVIDPDECGNWQICSVEEATFFEIYPPDIDDPKIVTICNLDVAAHTLAEAKAAIDEDIASTGE